jgi:hypothetical protein
MKTFVVFVVSPFLRACRYSVAEAVFKVKRRGRYPMPEELTLTSPYQYLIAESEDQFSPQRPRMPMNVSPVIQKWSNQQEKIKYVEGEGKGWELTLCILDRFYIEYGHGQPHA